MKDIVDLSVTQVRIYATDHLPYAELRKPVNTKAIKDSFHFEAVQVDPAGVQVVFNNGTLDRNKKSVHILSLAIDPRRTIVRVRGGSPAANTVASALADLLRSFDKRLKTDKLEPLILAQESECAATLDIGFDDLIAAPLLKVMQTEAKSKLLTKYSTPKSIAFKGLSFEVRYALTDPKLEDHDITLANKLITVEPRIGTPTNERRFYTSSPTDSETHLALLEALEREVSRSRHQKKP